MKGDSRRSGAAQMGIQARGYLKVVLKMNQTNENWLARDAIAEDMARLQKAIYEYIDSRSGETTTELEPALIHILRCRRTYAVRSHRGCWRCKKNNEQTK